MKHKLLCKQPITTATLGSLNYWRCDGREGGRKGDLQGKDGTWAREGGFCQRKGNVWKGEIGQERRELDKKERNEKQGTKKCVAS